MERLSEGQNGHIFELHGPGGFDLKLEEDESEEGDKVEPLCRDSGKSDVNVMREGDLVKREKGLKASGLCPTNITASESETDSSPKTEKLLSLPHRLRTE